MTEEQVMALLKKQIDQAGSAVKWAQSAGIAPSYVSDVLNGRRAPGDSILRKLGLQRVTTYVKRSV